MTYDSHSAIPQRVHTALSRFAELNLKIPAAVSDTYAQLQRVEAKPPRVDRYGLRDAIISGAKDEVLQQLALAELAEPLIESARLAARSHAAVGVMDAIEASADSLHKQLSAQAAKAIKVLEEAAAVGPIPLSALVRSGRHSEASAIAAAEITASQLDNLYTTRDRLLWPRRTRPAVDVSRWTETRFNGMSFIDGLTQGGKLWYPTITEAIGLANQIAAADDTGGFVDAGAA